MPQMAPYTLYGWKVSYFTGKLYSYLRYKNIPFVENNTNLLTLYRIVKQKTGAVVMPTMTTPDGHWLQDTRHIIDVLETKFPAPSVFPKTAKRMFVSSLFEAWGDEWWIPIAMHYRWSYPESVVMFRREVGDTLIPYAPRFLKDHAAGRTASVLIGYLPFVGVVPGQFAMMESWTNDMLCLLDNHFKCNLFLLGNGCPTIGDFGLMGPLYAHLSRDEWPKRNLMYRFPHILQWIDRMLTSYKDLKLDPDADVERSDDSIPDTLTPILRQIFTEFTPMMTGCLDQLNSASAYWPKGRVFNRTLNKTEPVSMPMGGYVFKRSANPFSLYKTQGESGPLIYLFNCGTK